MKTIPRIHRAVGSVTVPPSKSYTVRALLIAAMARGETTVLNALDCDDSRYMLDALRKIGFSTSGNFASGLTIGERKTMSANEVEINVGNAGTAMRFLAGFLAVTPGRFLLTGDSRMQQRPIGDLVDALRLLDVEIEYSEAEGFPPLRIRGKRIRGGTEITVSGEISSQFVSSVLMCATTLASGVTIRIATLSSAPYLEITKHILRAFGADLQEMETGTIEVQPVPLSAPQYVIEGDYSSASYWMAAAAITAGEVTINGLEDESVQGDRGFVDMLAQMGCETSFEGPALTIRGPVELRGGRFDCNATPDIVPTLAAIAPFASEPVEIVNIASLRVKESDRIAVIGSELRKLGVVVAEREDSLLVLPGLGDEPATIHSHDDHRIAMSFAIAGLRRGGVSIEGEKAVSKSYPAFWKTLDNLIASSSAPWDAVVIDGI